VSIVNDEGSKLICSGWGKGTPGAGLVFGLFGLGVAGVSHAHHSIAVHYDVDDIRPVTGTLQSIAWANPHTEWLVEVEGDDGESQIWIAEGGAVNTLRRNGITRELFPIGSEITIVGPVSRAGRPEMIAAQAIAGGNTYLLFPALADELQEDLPEPGQFSLTSAAGYEVTYRPAPDLFRVWTPVDFPATGVLQQPLPLTDTARARMAEYDPVADDLAVACIAAGMPSMLDQPYPVEFIDEGDRIVYRFEEWNGVRTIHMTDADPEDGIGSIYGHSVGRWDGDTLVIETTGIGYPYYNDAGAPMTEDMVVTERYAISEDGRRLDWTATSVDPSVFTEPDTLSGWAVWVPEIEIEDFRCLTE
jgi:hypothetical protein